MRRNGLVVALALAAIAGVSALLVIVVAWDRGGTGRADATPAAGDSPAIEATATLAPRPALFGDTVRAIVDITVDRNRVDPDSIDVTSEFLPFGTIGEPERARRDSSRTTHLRIAYTLRCLTTPCVPTGQSTSFQFTPTRVTFTDPAGKPRSSEALEVEWPLLLVYTRAASSVGEGRGGAIPWRADMLSLPPASYRVSPTLVLVLALVGCALFGALAIALIYLAWPRAAPVPPPEPAPEPEPELPPLEQALVLLEATVRTDGASDQRRALELVAEELAVREAGLATVARSLAWSEDVPNVEATNELAARVRSVLAAGAERDDDESEERTEENEEGANEHAL